MKNNKIQLLVLLGAGIVGTWLVQPVLRLWEVLLIGAASAIGVGAILGTLLIKGGFLRPGGIWGDGSVFRVAQGIGLAMFVYGSVRNSTTLIGIGALGLAIGSILEMRRSRLQRGA
jgi:hypothetical protein